MRTNQLDVSRMTTDVNPCPHGNFLRRLIAGACMAALETYLHVCEGVGQGGSAPERHDNDLVAPRHQQLGVQRLLPEQLQVLQPILLHGHIH